MRILLAEDDAMIGEVVHDALRAEGHAADWVRDGAQADTALATTAYDLLLLDLGLPRKSGLDVLRALRAHGQRLPVLIATARDAVAERVAGLDAGADDYVVKPAHLDELAARLRALLRRADGQLEPAIRVGALEVTPAARSATLAGTALELTAREYALLEMLVRHPGRAYSREQLEDALYGWDREVASNAVEVHIHHLRHKLGPGWIRTLRGIGYAINPPAGEPA